jgi:hypothetical protein
VHDSAGRAVSLLGFACGVSPVPLVPQEVMHLPLQSNRDAQYAIKIITLIF